MEKILKSPNGQTLNRLVHSDLKVKKTQAGVWLLQVRNETLLEGSFGDIRWAAAAMMHDYYQGDQNSV